MFCIKCQQKTQVINSRPSAHKLSVWRRRSCEACHYTLTTYEKIADDQLSVSDQGTEMPFSQARLLINVAESFGHVPKKQAASAEQLCQTVTHKLIATYGDRFSRQNLILTVFETLKNFDRLAAVQYGAKHANVLKSRLRHYL